MKLQFIQFLVLSASAHNLYMECTSNADCLEPGHACCSASNFDNSLEPNLCVYYTLLKTPEFVPLFSHLNEKHTNLNVYCNDN